MILPMIGNMLRDLVVDQAQSLAKEHLESALEKHLPKEAREELDKAIDSDSSHPHKSLIDLIKG